MPAGAFNINAEQGTTFKLHLYYKDSGGIPVDMSAFSPRMQVRKSPDSDRLLLSLSENGVTGGGSTGDFASDGGVSGSGGLSGNVSFTGGTGHTGGLLISIDADTMANCPSGNFFYDVELDGLNSVTRLLQGRFTVDREITR